jgi:hypothetical protein
MLCLPGHSLYNWGSGGGSDVGVRDSDERDNKKVSSMPQKRFVLFQLRSQHFPELLTVKNGPSEICLKIRNHLIIDTPL